MSAGSVVAACSASSSKNPGSLNNGNDGGMQIDGGGINPDLDGGATGGTARAIGSTGLSITRAKLGGGKDGAHELAPPPVK